MGCDRSPIAASDESLPAIETELFLETIRAILFDRDGTLIDFDPTWVPCFRRMLETLSGGHSALLSKLLDASGLDPDRNGFRRGALVLTHAPIDYARQWADALDVDFDDAFLSQVSALLLESCTLAVTPFNDTVSTISALKERGMTVGLATNGTQATALKQLEALGVLPHFEFVAGYDSGFGRKPGPGQLLAFAEQIGCQPNEVAMIGDSLHDMDAARAAGCRAIAVSTGAVPASELHAHSDHVIESLAGLLDLLPTGEFS